MSVSGLLRRWAIKVLALLLMGGLSACDDELTGLDGFGGDTDYEAA